MTNHPWLDRLAQATALEILRRQAPDYLDGRPGLQDAIAHLARLALEAHVLLYQFRQQDRAGRATADPGKVLGTTIEVW